MTLSLANDIDIGCASAKSPSPSAEQHSSQRPTVRLSPLPSRLSGAGRPDAQANKTCQNRNVVKLGLQLFSGEQNFQTTRIIALTPTVEAPKLKLSGSNRNRVRLMIRPDRGLPFAFDHSPVDQRKALEMKVCGAGMRPPHFRPIWNVFTAIAAAPGVTMSACWCQPLSTRARGTLGGGAMGRWRRSTRGLGRWASARRRS
jgi:hypothetical protein